MGRTSSLEIVQNAVDRAAIPSLAALLDEAASRSATLKSGIGALYRDPLGRPTADAILEWFWSSGIPALYRKRIGNDPALLIDFTTIRRHVPGRIQTRVGWHTDANFVGLDGTVRIAWVPMDPVGREAPGLEFALPSGPVSRRAYVDHLVRATQAETGTISDAEVATILGGGFQSWRPSLEPGDLLLFDQWCIHRTDPHIDRAGRTAIEFRMFSPQDPPRRVAEERSLLASLRGDDGRPAIRPVVEIVAPHAHSSAARG